jgi:hypothetical protein
MASEIWQSRQESVDHSEGRAFFNVDQCFVPFEPGGYLCPVGTRRPSTGKDERCRFLLNLAALSFDGKSIPDVGPLDALVRITIPTICGTDVHILQGEYPVAKGLTIGHEPVGVIEKLGSTVSGFQEGQRVIAGAITPSGYSNACLCGYPSQDGAGAKHGWKPMGGWKSATRSLAVRPNSCVSRTLWSI